MGRRVGWHRRSAHGSRRTRLQFDSLEQRRLLAIDIVGTAGDDSIAIIGTDTGFYASINGQVTNYTTSGLTDVNVDGLGGKDSVQVHKIRGAATLGALTGFVDGNLFRVALSNFETQYVFAYAYTDSTQLPYSAVLQGTPGNDTAYHFNTHSIMIGSANGHPFFNEILGFGAVRFEGNAGEDMAVSSPNEVSFVPAFMEIDATTRTATLMEVVAKFSPFTFRTEFTQFERIYAYRNPLWVGGQSCTFRGTSGNDTFYGLPDSAILSGDGYFYQSIGYDENGAWAGDGNDAAVFYTGTGSFTFRASPADAVMTQLITPRVKSSNAYGFDRVYAFASPGAPASASLNDGLANDVLFATSEYTLLYQPDNYLIQAIGFSTVDVTSNGGYDTAIILDRPGANRLMAFSEMVDMTYFGRSSVLIRAFDIVYANGLYGGVNRKATASTPQFPIVYAGIWFA